MQVRLCVRVIFVVVRCVPAFQLAASPVRPSALLLGLFKKAVLGDHLGAPAVDPVFAAPDTYGSTALAGHARLCHADLLRFLLRILTWPSACSPPVPSYPSISVCLTLLLASVTSGAAGTSRCPPCSRHYLTIVGGNRRGSWGRLSTHADPGPGWILARGQLDLSVWGCYHGSLLVAE